MPDESREYTRRYAKESSNEVQVGNNLLDSGGRLQRDFTLAG